MWRWRKRFPLCEPKNISRNAFAAPTVRRPCGFSKEPERGILRWRATNFPEIGKAQEGRQSQAKRQLLKLASSRGAHKNREAAEFIDQNRGVWLLNSSFNPDEIQVRVLVRASQRLKPIT